MQHGKSMAKNLKSQRIRIDEPGGDDQEMDADELDADAFLEDEGSLCWKHLTVKGCAEIKSLKADMEQIMGQQLSPVIGRGGGGDRSSWASN